MVAAVRDGSISLSVDGLFELGGDSRWAGWSCGTSDVIEGCTICFVVFRKLCRSGIELVLLAMN